MTDDRNTFADALILVVDDEVTQRMLTQDALEQEGFRVKKAQNGEDGLKLVRELRPDLVLLDIMMPGIDGYEVCRQLRDDPAICHTPVIILTGREGTEDIDKGFAAGATDFLTKPVIWNLLPSRIRYVLKSSRMEAELRIAKEAAEVASEAKSALLATMGHELRTPLNGIIGLSNLIKQEEFGPIGSPQYEEFVVDIHASGIRLLNAVNAILEIVNCESEKLELDEMEVDVFKLVEAVMKRMAKEAGNSGVRLVKVVSDGCISICGDEQRLHQALLSLVSNAVKYTGTGGAVRVDVRCSENEGLVFDVVDNGIGISAEDLPRIMEPFEQADSGLARNFEGLGLGIPLARAMFRMHGGNIVYESELGQGTTVHVTIPFDRVMTLSRDPSTVRMA